MTCVFIKLFDRLWDTFLFRQTNNRLFQLIFWFIDLLSTMIDLQFYRKRKGKLMSESHECAGSKRLSLSVAQASTSRWPAADRHGKRKERKRCTSCVEQIQRVRFADLTLKSDLFTLFSPFSLFTARLHHYHCSLFRRLLRIRLSCWSYGWPLIDWGHGGSACWLVPWLWNWSR